jgi:hypothetical protein
VVAAPSHPKVALIRKIKINDAARSFHVCSFIIIMRKRDPKHPSLFAILVGQNKNYHSKRQPI